MRLRFKKLEMQVDYLIKESRYLQPQAKVEDFLNIKFTFNKNLQAYHSNF